MTACVRDRDADPLKQITTEVFAKKSVAHIGFPGTARERVEERIENIREVNAKMAVAEEQVREALKQVVDPELFVNVVDLGLVYDVRIKDAEEAEGADIEVDMTMTSPACPAGPQILGQSKDAVSRLDGVHEVDVKLVMDPPWSPDRMSEDAKDQLGIF